MFRGRYLMALTLVVGGGCSSLHRRIGPHVATDPAGNPVASITADPAGGDPFAPPRESIRERLTRRIAGLSKPDPSLAAVPSGPSRRVVAPKPNLGRPRPATQPPPVEDEGPEALTAGPAPSPADPTAAPAPPVVPVALLAELEPETDRHVQVVAAQSVDPEPDRKQETRSEPAAAPERPRTSTGMAGSIYGISVRRVGALPDVKPSTREPAPPLRRQVAERRSVKSRIEDEDPEAPLLAISREEKLAGSIQPVAHNTAPEGEDAEGKATAVPPPADPFENAPDPAPTSRPTSRPRPRMESRPAEADPFAEPASTTSAASSVPPVAADDTPAPLEPARDESRPATAAPPPPRSKPQVARGLTPADLPPVMFPKAYYKNGMQAPFAVPHEPTAEPKVWHSRLYRRFFGENTGRPKDSTR